MKQGQGLVGESSGLWGHGVFQRVLWGGMVAGGEKSRARSMPKTVGQIIRNSADGVVKSKDSSGAVLVYTLWVLASLSFLALQTAAMSRLQASRTQWAWSRMEKKAVVESWLRLIAGPAGSTMPRGRWIAGQLGGRAHWVRLDDEKDFLVVKETNRMRLQGRIEEILKALPPAGVSPEALVDALLDWQDADDLVRLQGAERESYEALGLPAPTNAPFGSVCEMRLVMGMTPELFWGTPLADAEAQWKEESTKASGERHETAGLAFRLSAVGYGLRLCVLFPDGQGGLEIEVVVFRAGGGQWNWLDRCHGFINGFS